MALTKASTTSTYTCYREWRQLCEYLTYAALSAVAVYYMRIVPDSFHVSEQMMKIVDSGRFTQNSVLLRKQYTGISSFDYGLSFLVVAFMPAAAEFDKGSCLQIVHFLFSFFPVVSVWAVESCRRGNQRGMISFTAIWALFYQTVGGAIIIPLYFLAYTYTSSRLNYFSPTSQAVPINQARTLSLALLVGFLLPTILIFMPWEDADTKQFFVALWQPCPLFVNALHFLFTKISAFNNLESPKKNMDDLSANVRYLKHIYLTAFIISALVHVIIVIMCLTSTDPQLDLYYVFVPQQARGHLGLTEALHFILQIDWWVIFGASMIWCVQAMWDLNSMGKTSLRPLDGLVAVVLGAIVLGPGATLSLVWWWREERSVWGPRKRFHAEEVKMSLQRNPCIGLEVRIVNQVSFAVPEQLHEE